MEPLIESKVARVKLSSYLLVSKILPRLPSFLEDPSPPLRILLMMTGACATGPRGLDFLCREDSV